MSTNDDMQAVDSVVDVILTGLEKRGFLVVNKVGLERMQARIAELESSVHVVGHHVNRHEDPRFEFDMIVNEGSTCAVCCRPLMRGDLVWAVRVVNAYRCYVFRCATCTKDIALRMWDVEYAKAKADLEDPTVLKCGA
jgi:hypothetical protein